MNSRTRVSQIVAPLMPLLFLFVLIATAAAAQNASASKKHERLVIVDRAVAFHGGDTFQDSTISFTIGSNSGTFDIVAKTKGSLFDYTVTRTQDGKVTEWHHDNMPSGEHHVWRKEDGRDVALDEDGRTSARNSVAARVWFPLLALRLNDPNTWKQDLGLEEWNGKSLRRVRMTFTAGTSSRAEDDYALWFDDETGRLEAFAYSFNGGLRYRPLTNYRRVGGILFFDQPNYAWDRDGDSGPRPTVSWIDPDFVKDKMTLLSTVKLENLRVE